MIFCFFIVVTKLFSALGVSESLSPTGVLKILDDLVGFSMMILIISQGISITVTGFTAHALLYAIIILLYAPAYSHTK